MVKKAVLLMIGFLAGFILVFAIHARADAPEEVFLDIVPTPAPAPIQYPWTVERQEWSESEIDGLASIYWAECNTDTQRKVYTAVIWNRARHGAPFPVGLTAVMYQRGEFNHGRVSNRNREKAQEYLDQCAAGVLTIPDSAVYISREGQTMRLYDIQWRLVMVIG